MLSRYGCVGWNGYSSACRHKEPGLAILSMRQQTCRTMTTLFQLLNACPYSLSLQPFMGSGSIPNGWSTLPVSENESLATE